MSARKAFRIGSFNAQFHAVTAVDGITVLYSGGTESDGAELSTKTGDIIDGEGDSEVIEL